MIFLRVCSRAGLDASTEQRSDDCIRFHIQKENAHFLPHSTRLEGHCNLLHCHSSNLHACSDFHMRRVQKIAEFVRPRMKKTQHEFARTNSGGASPCPSQDGTMTFF